jgi:hypothetical protein
MRQYAAGSSQSVEKMALLPAMTSPSAGVDDGKGVARRQSDGSAFDLRK